MVSGTRSGFFLLTCQFEKKKKRERMDAIPAFVSK